jgi:hypothetical protein
MAAIMVAGVARLDRVATGQPGRAGQEAASCRLDLHPVVAHLIRFCSSAFVYLFICSRVSFAPYSRNVTR